MRVIGVFALCVASTQAFVVPNSLSVARSTTSKFSSSISMVTVDELKAAKKELQDMLDRTNATPIMVRLAWHDSGTFDKNSNKEWPLNGGADGSIRFSPEIDHGANAGLVTALKLLEPIKKKCPNVSWADLIQMASAVGIEQVGGPKIDMIYGRLDASGPEQCPPEGNLPGAAAPFGDGCATPQEHLRKVFYRMGFDDRGIVALSGAHTLGRAYPERSGFGKESTKYTDGSSIARHDGKPGIGRKGGQSWTANFLTFDNSYFKDVPETDEELLKLETDSILFADDDFRAIALEYKKDEGKFFSDYAVAHKQLSELGSKFEPAGGIKI